MKTFLRIYALTLILGLSGAVGWGQIPSVATPKMIREIYGYSSWTVANQTPVMMDPSVGALCIAPPPNSRSSIPFKGSQGPHAKKWLRVFVNRIGEEAMLTQEHPRFPVGTVIVKQKLPSVSSKTGKGKAPQRPSLGAKPELLTVMIKREVNYDKANGDWEYMVTDGKGEKVAQRGKLASCQGCHRPYKKTDYVVRSYLPEKVEKALKDLSEIESKSEAAKSG